MEKIKETSIVQVGVTYEDNTQCFEVQCGCMSFVFIGKEKLMDFLGKYIANPNKVENDWYRRQERNGLKEGPVPEDRADEVEALAKRRNRPAFLQEVEGG